MKQKIKYHKFNKIKNNYNNNPINLRKKMII